MAGKVDEALVIAGIDGKLENKMPVGETYGVSKILQNMQKVCIIYEVRGCTYFVTGSFASLLQGMDRSTGEAICAAIRRMDPGTDARENCERKVRFSVPDGAVYTERAEKGVAELRPGRLVTSENYL